MFCCRQNVVRHAFGIFAVFVFSVVSFSLVSVDADAQSPQQVAQITRLLSPDSQKVIERLGTFRPTCPRR